jgi:DNA-binding transcriptional LysR family regulator
MAVRIGDLEDSTLRARKLCETTRRMIAAPLLPEVRPPHADRRPERAQAAALLEPVLGNVWKLTAPSGEKRQVRTAGWLTVNDGQSLLNAAIAGLGIAYLPSFLYADAMTKGLVEEAIPTCRRHAGHLRGLSAGPLHPAQGPAFIDFLVDAFAEKGPDKW